MSLKEIITLVGAALLAIFITGCNSSGRETPQHYKKQVDAWHTERIKNLKQDDSWLSLAGLYWLGEGTNSFGSDSTNDLVFPPKAPAKMGAFTLKDSIVRVSISPHVTVTADSQAVSSMRLTTDAGGNPTVLHLGSLSWYIIKRGDRWGVRLKDAKSELITNFKGIERYPVQSKWRVKASFTPYDSAKIKQIPTVLGERASVTVPGKLTFTINRHSYKILPIQETKDADEWFIVFGDQTNENATYGGGRFMYIAKPGADSTTYIDFNKAYNPPCAFTAFATCPLPPAENKLAIAVSAGEKKYKGHHHTNHP